MAREAVQQQMKLIERIFRTSGAMRMEWLPEVILCHRVFETLTIACNTTPQLKVDEYAVHTTCYCNATPGITKIAEDP